MHMKIIEMEVSKIIPYERNNKIHDETQINRIANSIKEFGFRQPIVVDKNNIIIVGHGRFEWAKKLGLKKVPVEVADDLTDEQIKKYRILDNKLNESDYNLANLKSELDSLKDFNIGDLEISVSDLFPEFDAPEFDPDEFGEDFTLPKGEKSEFEQITFTCTNEQMEKVREAIDSAKNSPDMVQAEAMGNENKNGNALYVMAMQYLANI